MDEDSFDDGVAGGGGGGGRMVSHLFVMGFPFFLLFIYTILMAFVHFLILYDVIYDGSWP